MMEIEAGLYMLLRQGSYHDLCLNLGGSKTFTAHLTPMHIYSYTPCMYLQCTGQQWAGWQINGFTSMYKLYTQEQWKGG